MDQHQYTLLKQYSESLEVENNSKLQEINFLVSELNRISEDNRILNEQLNFISMNNNRQTFEGQIHELEFTLQQKEDFIQTLIRDIQHLEMLLNNSQAQNRYVVQEIKEYPREEDQKTDRMSEEASKRIEQLERNEREHIFIINNLEGRLAEKEMEVADLLAEERNKAKLLEDYLIEKLDYEERICILGNENDLLKLAVQNLKQVNERTMATSISFSNQVEDLKKQIAEKNNNLLKSTQHDEANNLLHNMVSELSAEVMLCKVREEEWDRESIRIHSEIRQLMREVNNLKSRESMRTHEHSNGVSTKQSYLVSSAQFLSPMKTSVTRTECESSGTKTDIPNLNEASLGRAMNGRTVDIRSSGNIPGLNENVVITNYRTQIITSTNPI